MLMPVLHCPDITSRWQHDIRIWLYRAWSCCLRSIRIAILYHRGWFSSIGSTIGCKLEIFGMSKNWPMDSRYNSIVLTSCSHRTIRDDIVWHRVAFVLTSRGLRGYIGSLEPRWQHDGNTNPLDGHTKATRRRVAFVIPSVAMQIASTKAIRWQHDADF